MALFRCAEKWHFGCVLAFVPELFQRHCTSTVQYHTRVQGFPTISWTAETVEIFLPPLSVSETDITKALSQYSSVMICVRTITLPILAMVWGLRTCELVVTNKSCLLTCVLPFQQSKIARVSTATVITPRPPEMPSDTPCPIYKKNTK